MTRIQLVATIAAQMRLDPSRLGFTNAVIAQDAESLVAECETACANRVRRAFPDLASGPREKSTLEICWSGTGAPRPALA